MVLKRKRLYTNRCLDCQARQRLGGTHSHASHLSHPQDVSSPVGSGTDPHRSPSRLSHPGETGFFLTLFLEAQSTLYTTHDMM